LVSDACDLFLIAAEDKGVRLEALVEPPVWVRCDHNALNRVMGHLLDNAVKYTSSGGQITVTAHRHGDRAVIQVQDTGIGIPREELEHVFKRFYRSDRSRSQSGNGMGLSLSAALVTAHKGTIRVQSEEGKGSTFTVTLPASGYLV
jgi:signal transduction histidine kinase